jgi:hypothetical protein
VATALMSGLIRAVCLAMLVVLLGGMVVLATWEIPPPTARVERVIPADRLLR